MRFIVFSIVYSTVIFGAENMCSVTKHAIHSQEDAEYCKQASEAIRACYDLDNKKKDCWLKPVIGPDYTHCYSEYSKQYLKEPVAYHPNFLRDVPHMKDTLSADDAPCSWRANQINVQQAEAAYTYDLPKACNSVIDVRNSTELSASGRTLKVVAEFTGEHGEKIHAYRLKYGKSKWFDWSDPTGQQLDPRQMISIMGLTIASFFGYEKLDSRVDTYTLPSLAELRRAWRKLDPKGELIRGAPYLATGQEGEASYLQNFFETGSLPAVDYQRGKDEQYLFHDVGLHVPAMVLMHPLLSKALAARVKQVFEVLVRLGDAKVHAHQQATHLTDTEFASIYLMPNLLGEAPNAYYNSERLCVYFGGTKCMERLLSPLENQVRKQLLETEPLEIIQVRNYANSIVAPKDRNNHQAMFVALFEEQKARLNKRICEIRRSESLSLVTSSGVF
ncbi:MAG: hypothetical protein JKY15_05935 [Deltaproteobacteria bacterium]|nr:hypothetical protein [Deltaproteobacteria bacterium]